METQRLDRPGADGAWRPPIMSPHSAHRLFAFPYPGSPRGESLHVITHIQYQIHKIHLTGPWQSLVFFHHGHTGREWGPLLEKRTMMPTDLDREGNEKVIWPRSLCVVVREVFGHHLVMGWTGAVPQGFQSTHQHPKRPHHCASWSRRLWLRNPRHLSLLRDTACYISRHLVLGVDGGGPDLGSGLMPGALVTHLNGERISLLTTSIYNRIVDPDPLDPDPPDTNPTDMSVISNFSACVL